MRIVHVFICFMLLVVACSKPDSSEIIKKSIAECNKIENGQYRLSSLYKYMDKKDTTKTLVQCTFIKESQDTLLGVYAKNEKKDEEGNSYHLIYNEQGLMSYRSKDSLAVFISSIEYPTDIVNRNSNFLFYTPFTNISKSWYPAEKLLDSLSHEFRLIGTELINNVACHHIQWISIPDSSEGGDIETLKHEINFWISTSNYLPIQMTNFYHLVFFGDTLQQFEQLTLENYQTNIELTPEVFSSNTVPNHYQIKPFEPYKRPDLLKKESIAPTWKLPLISGDSIALKDQQGKVVLLDFFYKSCYPCLLALPGLQTLHEKYESKGLKVIGLNPFDSIEKDDIGNFLSNKGITYDIALQAKPIAALYHVSGYPTFYLMNQSGAIIYANSGFSEENEKELEQIIIENL